MPKIVFLDTNIYLHYRDFDQIDWLKVLNTDAVTIIIPPVTIRELNKHKDSTISSPRIRKRAGVIFKKLAELFESSSQAQVKANITIRHEANDPDIFKAHNLNSEIQDDHLIASIIMCRDEMPKAEIVLVTADTGLILLGKARKLGIVPIKLPDEYKLPDELDPDQERIRELERELRELKSKTPHLSLIFDNKEQHTQFILSHPLEWPEAAMKTELADLKQRYQKRELPITDEQQGTYSLLAMNTLNNLYTTSVEDISKYNAELDEFYKEYAMYRQKEVDFQNLMRRKIELKIWLANEGNAPADDIDIFLTFPSWLIVRRDDNLPRAPISPKPPSPPKTPMETMFALPHEIIGGVPHSFPDISYGRHPLANVSSPEITYTPDPKVRIRVKNIKHNLQEPLDTLHVILASFSDACSFHIDYKMLAANVSKPILGKLNIIIQKQS